MTVSHRILRLKAVLDRTGLSRSTLYRKISESTFPKQIQISKRCAGWREAAIEQWLVNPMSYSASQSPAGLADEFDANVEIANPR
jgi:prophage regulatory protein